LTDERERLDINKLFPLFTQTYSIPFEFKGIVKTAINRYAQPCKYSETALNKMVDKRTSPLNTFKYLTTNNKCNYNYNQWKGHLAEWMICYEYNSIKNKGNVVFTFVNPDSSSKADILHVIKVGNGFKCVAGPDIKTGGADYLINQLEKVWKHEGNIPFYDCYGVLSDEKKLTKKQLCKLRGLKEKYPKKVILTPSFKREEVIKFSDRYLRKVANQKTGPRSSAVKKACLNAPEMIGKEKFWTQFNYLSLEKELIVKQEQADRKQMELEREKQLNEILNKQKVVQEKPTVISWIGKVGKKFATSSLGKFIKENKKEIITDIVFTLGNAVIENANSNKNTRGLNTTPTQPLNSFQNENNNPRSLPIEHQVSSYFRKDGTPVKGYIRGRKN
jgi:hypothetical protein